MPDVAVIDYGMGNLLSVRRGFEKCSATVDVTSDARIILDAPRVVLPGVGAFSQGMAELCRLKLDDVAREIARRGTPLLGICLGMQMLFDGSEEFGTFEGLGIIPGHVIAVPPTSIDGHPLKIPHIGWNDLVLPEDGAGWEGTILQDVEPGDAAYFIHSFMAVPERPNHRIADCLYGGQSVAAAIGRDNIHGCQFHPEKSGEMGLKILRNFLSQ